MRALSVRYAALAAVLLLFGVFLVWPVWSVISTGLGLSTPGVELASVGAYLTAVLQDQQFRTGAINSAVIAALVTVCCVAISVPLAILNRRFEFPGKSLLAAFMLVPLVLPPFVGAIGIRLIFGAQGALTALCQHIGLVPPGTPVNWLADHPFGGVVVSEAFSLYPILFVNVVTALSFVDPALEQAAANLGASAWRIFRSVTLPLMLPGVFAGASIVFIWSFSELGTPLMFDFYDVTPVQVYFRITEISNNPLPYALLIVTMLGCCVVYALGKLAAGWGNQTGWTKTPAALGTSQLKGLPAIAVATPFVIVILLALLPHIGVVLTSFSQTGQWYESVLPRVFTTAHYEHALSHELALPSIRNSLVFSGLSVVLDVALGLGLGILIVRSKLPFALRAVLDSLSMLPLAVPGLVLAFGYLAISLQIKAWFPDLKWLLQVIDVQKNPTLLLVMAYTIRRLPYVVRSTVAGLEQTPEELELAARNIGATRSQTLLRITTPLLGANLVAGGLMVFAFTMLEVSDSLILVQKQSYWPITRGIFELFQRLGDGPYIASALGAWAMLLLTLILVLVNSLLGKRVGALFKL
ncbi:MAG TPA: iron ABC transporter permease [Steroidobacteraceae bacterium]|nr:iron ABC transporter permease [Steroidobacteraceae bacterium]